jgi:hypothetical protein
MRYCILRSRTLPRRQKTQIDTALCARAHQSWTCARVAKGHDGLQIVQRQARGGLIALQYADGFAFKRQIVFRIGDIKRIQQFFHNRAAVIRRI